MIKLFHGSYLVIDEIDLTKSKVGKDFGVGFYLSPDLKQAQNQAQNVAFRMNLSSPTVTTFCFDESLLSEGSLRIKLFEDYSEEWAQFILKNRNNKTRINIHDYDIVYGPIANDTVGVQLRRFLEGYIDLKQLVKELKYLRGITFQYMFATQKAIDKLQKQ